VTVGHSWQSAADFHDEVKGLLSSGSRCLDRNRYEIDAGCDVSVVIIVASIIIIIQRRFVFLFITLDGVATLAY